MWVEETDFYTVTELEEAPEDRSRGSLSNPFRFGQLISISVRRQADSIELGNEKCCDCHCPNARRIILLESCHLIISHLYELRPSSNRDVSLFSSMGFRYTLSRS